MEITCHHIVLLLSVTKSCLLHWSLQWYSAIRASSIGYSFAVVSYKVLFVALVPPVVFSN